MKKIVVYARYEGDTRKQCGSDGCTTCPDVKFSRITLSRARGGRLATVGTECRVGRYLMTILKPNQRYKLVCTPRLLRSK